MKTLLLFLFPLALFGQNVDSIASDYDMVTITGGTTLVDQSGNAHNGTIGSGITSVSTGLSYPGTALTSIPAVVGNSDFLVMVLVSGSSGISWYEGDNSNNLVERINAGSQGGNSYLNGTGGSVSWSPFQYPNYFSDWHVYFLQRSHATVITGCLDQNLYQSKNLGNVTALGTTYGALGGQLWSSGSNSFVTQIQGWARVRLNPKPGDLQSDYAAIRSNVAGRGIYLPDLVTGKYPTAAWQRQGTVLASTSNGVANEKVLALTTDCQLVSNPCLAMVADYGSILGYTESTDGLNWHALTTITLSGTRSSGGYQPGWLYDPATGKYWLTTSYASSAGLDVYSSAAHTPNAYTLVTHAIVTASGLSWSSINNSAMSKVGSTIYLVFDGYLSGCGGTCGVIGGITTTDYNTWTVAGATPLTGNGYPEAMGGPTIAYLNNEWYMWGHGATQSGWLGGIYRRQAASFNSIWQRSSPSGFPLTGNPIPTFSAAAPDEYSQLASASLVTPPWNAGQTYLYYCSADASNVLHIKLAIANMPMSQLVLTGEGASTDVP